MKKKILIVIAIIFAVIIIAVAIIAFKHRNTVGAVIDAVRYTGEEVEQKIEDNKQELQEYIDDKESIAVRELTEDESNALEAGVLSPEEAIAIITGEAQNIDFSDNEAVAEVKSKKVTYKNNDHKDNASESEKAPQPEEPKKAEKPKQVVPQEGQTDRKVSELIAQLYVEKSQYKSKLEGVLSQISHDYQASEATGHEGFREKQISYYAPIISSWESECDAKVNSLLSQIETELKNAGKSTDVVSKIKEAYENEKKLTKAYYINNYF